MQSAVSCDNYNPHMIDIISAFTSGTWTGLDIDYGMFFYSQKEAEFRHIYRKHGFLSLYSLSIPPERG